MPNKVDGAVIRKIELVDKDGKMSAVDFADEGDLVKLHIYAKPGVKIYKTSSVEKSKEIEFVKNKPIVTKERTVKEIILPQIGKQKETGKDKKELLVKVYSLQEGKDALKYTDKVFYNIFAEDFSEDFSAYLPRILNDADLEKAVKLIEKYNLKNVLIGDLGAYLVLKKNKNLNLYLDYSNNVFNDLDLVFFDDCMPIISPELSFDELKEFSNKNFAVLVHGKVVMMNTKYSLLPLRLTDKKDYIFSVRKEHDYYQILNSVELGLFESVNELINVGVGQLFLDLDNGADYILKFYHNIINNKKNLPINRKNYTKGHWDNGVA